MRWEGWFDEIVLGEGRVGGSLMIGMGARLVVSMEMRYVKPIGVVWS